MQWSLEFKQYRLQAVYSCLDKINSFLVYSESKIEALMVYRSKKNKFNEKWVTVSLHNVGALARDTQN